MDMEYIITAKTSQDYKVGSTDGDVLIKLVKGKGEAQTEWIKLDNFWRNDFERGQTDTFKINCKDVGSPIIIGLKINNAKAKEGWKCDTIKVQKSGSDEVSEFLVYNWLHTELWVYNGEATLPQTLTFPFAADIRKAERQANLFNYQWHTRATPENDYGGWGMPNYVNADTVPELPMFFRGIDDHVSEFDERMHKVELNALFHYGKDKIFGSGLKNLDDYHELYNHSSVPYSKPAFIDVWKTDNEMGRQMLNGVNPTTLSRCTEIPKGFHVTSEIVANLLDDGKCLESEMKSGKIYIADYREYTNGIPRNTNYEQHCADSACLFYVDKAGNLRPIAIQFMGQDYVFTPNDSADDWLLAKIYFRSNEVNVQEWKYHFSRTHSITEPVSIAMFRNLPSSHPIYKLTRQHLRSVTAINAAGRTDFLLPKSGANKAISLNGIFAIKKALKSLNYDELNIKKLLKNQGIDDEKLLPNFHFRTDALLLWDVIEKYIRSTVDIFYLNDQDVQNDTELQAWINDTAMEGIGWQDGNTKGFPTSLNSVDELVEYITSIVFTCSVGHACQNFGGYDMYRFVPNSPGSMRLPVHEKGQANHERIMDSLPSDVQSCLQIGLVFVLSEYGPQDVFLGNIEDQLFINEKAIAIQKIFKADLEVVTEKINARNKDLKFPYEFLLPSRIPNSIGV